MVTPCLKVRPACYQHSIIHILLGSAWWDMDDFGWISCYPCCEKGIWQDVCKMPSGFLHTCDTCDNSKVFFLVFKTLFVSLEFANMVYKKIRWQEVSKMDLGMLIANSSEKSLPFAMVSLAKSFLSSPLKEDLSTKRPHFQTGLNKRYVKYKHTYRQYVHSYTFTHIHTMTHTYI